MSDTETCYQAPMKDGMTYRIMRGHSVQNSAVQTVIFDHLGHRWHTFDSVIPVEAAEAVITAYKAGVVAGREQADADTGKLLAALKDVASRATAAIARHQT